MIREQRAAAEAAARNVQPPVSNSVVPIARRKG
jgi:hypothetical protein